MAKFLTVDVRRRHKRPPTMRDSSGRCALLAVAVVLALASIGLGADARRPPAQLVLNRRYLHQHLHVSPPSVSSSSRALRIPRGGTAHSLPPNPPPIDEAAVAEAARVAAIRAAEEEAKAADAAAAQQAAAAASPSAVEAAQAPPPTKDHTRNLSAKLSNAWERTVPAVLMLGAATALLKVTGTKGLIALVLALQVGMYHETTSIIEAFHRRSDPGSADLKKLTWLDAVEKWWWFATVLVGTSGRNLLGATAAAASSSSVGGVSTEALNLICYGMVAVGLVGAVVGMEMHSRSGPEMFRDYLGGVAACNFVLVSACFGSKDIIWFYLVPCNIVRLIFSCHVNNHLLYLEPTI